MRKELTGNCKLRVEITLRYLQAANLQVSNFDESP